MERPSTRRVIETCLARGAAEAWLMSERPPMVRFPEHVRELSTVPSLTSDDIARMVFEDLAPNLAEWYRDRGFCAFDYPCSWRDDTRVRVFVLRHGGGTFVTLTPLAPGSPELRYADADRAAENVSEV